MGKPGPTLSTLPNQVGKMMSRGNGRCWASGTDSGPMACVSIQDKHHESSPVSILRPVPGWECWKAMPHPSTDMSIPGSNYLRHLCLKEESCTPLSMRVWAGTLVVKGGPPQSFVPSSFPPKLPQISCATTAIDPYSPSQHLLSTSPSRRSASTDKILFLIHMHLLTRTAGSRSCKAALGAKWGKYTRPPSTARLSGSASGNSISSFSFLAESLASSHHHPLFAGLGS
jgi:hypothetical protein